MTQDKLLVTKIYTSPRDSGTKKAQLCSYGEDVSGKYWPFHSQVTKKMDELRQLCQERNANHSLYVAMKQLKHRRQYLEKLRHIVAHLEPEKIQEN